MDSRPLHFIFSQTFRPPYPNFTGVERCEIWPKIAFEALC